MNLRERVRGREEENIFIAARSYNVQFYYLLSSFFSVFVSIYSEGTIPIAFFTIITHCMRNISYFISTSHTLVCLLPIETLSLTLVNLVFNICIKDLCAMDVPFTHGGIYWFARSLSTYFMVIAELLTGASDDV